MIKKNWHIKIIILSSFLVTLLFFISSCEKQNITFGSDFVDNSITNIVLVDTTTVDIATIQVDSSISSNTNTILAGKFADAQFGTINAQSFLQLGLPVASYDIPDGSVFDSIEVVMRLNKSFYGDTLATYNLSVYQLNDPITYPANQFGFYNTNTRTYNSTALGSNQWTIQPGIRDTLSIRLANSLGLDLFNKLQAKDPTVTSIGEFINYFKGLAIAGGSNNNLLVGFSDSLTMRLHYHKPAVFEQTAVISFGINQANYQFNNITVDRTGKATAGLAASRILPSTQTNNMGFAQYITGSMVKIRFPYIRDLYLLPNFIKIIKAQLIIKPVQNSFTGIYRLPPYLRLAVTDQYNLIGANLSLASSASASNVQYGNLYIDNLYGTSTEYTYDVTSYLQAQIATSLNNQNGLLILPPNPTAIFNRVLIANGVNNAAVKTVVKIYYASVK